jgi:sigma-E factor negative regulatory protein RseC
MEETGTVIRIDGPKAFVAVQKQGACDKCAMGSVCKGEEGDEAGIEAVNAAGAGVGDTVRVVFRTYSYLKGSVLVYGIPALLLVAGAIIGKECAGRFFPAADSDVVSALTAFGLFAAGFMVIRLLATKLDSGNMPVIEEIINEK